MTSADLLQALAETTLASSLAIGLVLLVRRPLRRRFGASAAHAAWATVPAAVAAVLMPAMAIEALPTLALGGFTAVGAAQATPPEVVVVPAAWLVAAWLCGAAAMALGLAMQQRAFLRSLGAQRLRADGLYEAAAVAGLPAVVGLVRPRTVVPVDFDTRYSPEQQALLRAHEQAHVAHGDLWANALVAAMRCLGWFNPLVHLAARCFRHDQELACDQRVLAARPGSRRAYGEAMFTTQLAAQPLPLGCHWGFGHPLKERIQMLTQPLPSQRRRLAGATIAAFLAAATGAAAWAAQPTGPAAPVAPPTAARADGPLVEPPESVSLQPPAYPAAAAEARQTGKVVLLVDIDARGNVSHVEVEHAHPAGVFDAQAVEAAKAWKFEPETKDGRPVPSRVRVPVQFEMDPEVIAELTAG